jgi:hypothetical protein
MSKAKLAAVAALLTSICCNAHADGGVRADSHAPIGVMAEHMHKTGEWMLSYRFMVMDMQGNLQGSDNIDPDTIVTTEPNRFAGMAGMPPTLRVVPLDMRMDMHMFGAMYAPSDRVTLMFMANYLKKSMQHVTYMGGIGTTVLDNFKTESSGWGDTSASAMISIVSTAASKVHAIVGVSVPTGATNVQGEILTPMNMRPTVRLPYPMQLGSGTYDPLLGLSYSGFADRFSWGAQWRGTFRTGNNDDGYRLGDEHRFTGWFSTLFTSAVSGSIRLEHYNRDNISGIDPSIIAPVQTADPSRQGSNRTDAGIGLNFAASGAMSGWRFAVEYVTPIDQDLDGPQLETDSQLILGVQKSFH